MHLSCRRGLAIAGIAMGALASVASGRLPQQDGTTTISQADVRISGVPGRVGDIQPAGDVNGDGFGDVMFGSDFASPLGRPAAGMVTIVFGSAAQGPIDATALSGRSITIAGAAAGDFTGNAVARAGDVNGDGRDDIVVGAYVAAPGGNSQAGSAYVVFGTATPAAIDLSALGAGGFRIDGAAPSNQVGYSVAGIGDVNLDGLADIGVGARGFAGAAGAAFVIFGRSATTTINVGALGTQGYRVDGAVTPDQLGTGVTGVGDVNGDGRPDLAVSAPDANGIPSNIRNDSGVVYVVYGKATTAPVSVATFPNAEGTTIQGAAVGDLAGTSLDSAGDVNGDGRRDLVVGAIAADANFRASSGSAFVVFMPATPAAIDLANLSGTGFRVDGAVAGQRVGQDVAGIGDVNDDGLSDIAVAPQQMANAGYVVFGGAGSASVDLLALGARGVTISGSTAGIEMAYPIGGAGDFNGDGRADVVGLAQGSSANEPVEIGIFYGWGTPGFSYPTLGSPLVVDEDRSITPLLPSVARRTGTPAFSISPALPTGLMLDPATGVLSGTPTSGSALTDYTVTMTDLAASVTQPLRLQVRDLTPPTVVLGGRRSQRVLAVKRFTSTVRCAEACAAVATASIVLPGGKTLLVGRKRLNLAAGRTTTIRFALSNATRRRLEALLATRRFVPVRLAVVATDAAGNRGAPTRKTFRATR